MQAVRVIWDCGTGYDLFVSLKVLHEPARYGLRGAWAKGVRARLSAPEREILEQALSFVWPMGWVHTLPEPKDGATVLAALERVPPAERLALLALPPQVPREASDLLRDVSVRGTWSDKELQALKTISRDSKSGASETPDLTRILEWFSRPQAFGERYLGALRTFYEAFFVEEEARIRPALEKGLARAQELAARLPLPALLEKLSQGLRMTELPRSPELVLAPSFWSTPLLVFAQVSVERELILFGARPPDASLVPGETVPDALMRALKALAHPTRLRILRYLVAEPLAPSQLARRLRLRAPTVVHHLDALRVAELVHLTLDQENERRYAARPKALQTALAALKTFLELDHGSVTSRTKKE